MYASDSPWQRDAVLVAGAVESRSHPSACRDVSDGVRSFFDKIFDLKTCWDAIELWNALNFRKHKIASFASPFEPQCQP